MHKCVCVATCLWFFHMHVVICLGKIETEYLCIWACVCKREEFSATLQCVSLTYIYSIKVNSHATVKWFSKKKTMHIIQTVKRIEKQRWMETQKGLVSYLMTHIHETQSTWESWISIFCMHVYCVKCVCRCVRLWSSLTFCNALEGPLFLLPLGRPLGRLGTGSPVGSWGKEVNAGHEHGKQKRGPLN